MGGSRIAIRTCQYLPNNIRVKVIETNKEKSHRIAEVVPGNVLIINGDGRDTDLLMQEGIKDAQAFIALTDNSSTNIWLVWQLNAPEYSKPSPRSRILTTYL